MPTLFVLLPAGQELATLLGGSASAVLGQVSQRRYPRASDSRHLLSLVRQSRDATATRWRRGLVLAVAGGAVLGAIVHAVLAAGFDMFGGLIELAVPLGAGVGAFLGGFTAMMTGTEVAREEVRQLARHTVDGDVLVQLQAPERAPLVRLRSNCEALGLHCALVE